MGSIIIVTICLFLAVLFGSYYIQARMRERSKTSAQIVLERIMEQQRAKGVTRLTPEEEAEIKAAESSLLPSLGPLDKLADFIRRRFLPDTRRDEVVKWLDRQLMYAGLTEKNNRNMTSQDIIAYVIVYWTVVLASMFFLAFVIGFPKILSTVLLVLFVMYPYLRLRQLVSERKEQIFFELPVFMDDLVANLSAGATVIDEALAAVIETNLSLPQRKRKILPEEFGQAFAEFRYAGRNRNEALQDVSDRLGVPAVSEFVDLLIQGLETGFPIRTLLIKQSRQVHELWKQEMRTYIGKKESAFVISVGLIAIGVLVLFMSPLMVNIADSVSQTN